MFARARWSTLLWVSLVLVGCRRESQPDGSKPSTTAASSTPSTPPPPPLGTPLDPATLPQRFAEDAANRPRGVVTTEQVWSWLEADRKLQLRDKRQHLSGPFHARYCQGTQSANDVHFSVCEYTSEDEAKAGAEAALAFGSTNRRIVRNGRTLLITRYPAGYDIDALEKGFLALQPKA